MRIGVRIVVRIEVGADDTTRPARVVRTGGDGEGLPVRIEAGGRRVHQGEVWGYR